MNDTFLAWLLLGGLGMSYGAFEALYNEGGDEAIRRTIGYSEFDPSI